MKKRIALALSMIMMILMLGACGTDPTTVDYNGHSYDDLKTDMYSSISMVQAVASLFEESDMTADTVSKDVIDALNANYGVTEEQIAGAGKWMDVTDEFGECKGEDEDSFTVTKSGETLTTDLTLNFEKKKVDFQVVYDYYSMEITGITVEPIYSLSEKMSKAGINTLISISIVFAVLILISLLIACFNIFPYLEKKKAAKKAAVATATAEVTAEEPAAAPVQPVQTKTDDTELIAVIAAAIAASSGTSTNDFVVRSINRR
ncbi:MAG: OadG family protein [Agathobacter sp.]|nr:OadG family protein [Agathobacter sp.]